MSARPIIVADSVQRETKREPAMQHSPEQDIANLAYALWQKRGCPEGSPEEDWIQAEALIQTSPGK
jgi:hypothetical protein